MGTTRPDTPPLESPMRDLETALIDNFLRERGYDPANLPPSERDALLREASIYASARLSEVESRAQFVHHLHDEHPRS